MAEPITAQTLSGAQKEDVRQTSEGSQSSGNYGHSGRQGKVGGSSGSAVNRASSVPDAYDYGTKIGGLNLRPDRARDIANALKRSNYRAYESPAAGGKVELRIAKNDLDKATKFLKARNYKEFRHFRRVLKSLRSKESMNPIEKHESAEGDGKEQSGMAMEYLSSCCDTSTMPEEVKSLWIDAFLDSWLEHDDLDKDVRRSQAAIDADAVLENGGWVNVMGEWKKASSSGGVEGDKSDESDESDEESDESDDSSDESSESMTLGDGEVSQDLRITSEIFNAMSPRIDKKANVISGVVLFAPKFISESDGFISASGNSYSTKFVREEFSKVEGGLSFDGHPEMDSIGRFKDRKPSDAMGRIRNVRLENDKWIGDYHVFNHRADSVMSLIEEGWDTLGLSICGVTIGKNNSKGEYVAERFTNGKRRPTVDLVDCSGATVNVFESLPIENNKPKEQELEMKEAIDAAKIELEKIQSDLSKAKREALISRKLAESKLDEKFVTESLRLALSSCGDDRVDALIAEHKNMIAAQQKTVKESGASADDAAPIVKSTLESVVSEVRERDLTAIVERLSDGKKGKEGATRAAERFTAEILPLIRQEVGEHDAKKSDALQKISAGVSIKEIFEAVTGVRANSIRAIHEAAIVSTGYTTITGALLASIVIDGYNVAGIGLVGDQLVRPYNSKLKSETFAGFNASTGIADVAEAAVYPDATVAEKFVGDAAFSKRGAKVLISEEAIMFDQTGQLLSRANEVGAQLRLDREKMILKSIADLALFKVFYPSGVQDDIWDNLVYFNDQANTLVDYTDLELASIKLDQMVDSNGDRIMDNNMSPVEILVPSGLRHTLDHILNSQQLWTGTGQTQINEANSWRGSRAIVSKVLDSINATTWYYAGGGGFKKQFIEKIHIPFEVAQVPPDEANRISNDIVGGIRARYKSKVFALDTKYVIRNT